MRLAVVVVLAAAGLLGQERSEGALSLLTDAEDALAKGRKEEAAFLLRAAARELPAVASETLRASLERTIAELARRADPLEPVRRKAGADAVKALAQVADGYAQAGWVQTALALLEQGARYDPAAGREALEQRRTQLGPVLDKLLGLPAEPETPAANQQLVEWFTGGKLIWGIGAWKLTQDGIESPQGIDQPTQFVTSRKTGGKARVSLQVRTGARPAHVAMVLAGRGPSACCLLSVHHEAKDTLVQVLRFAGQEYEVVRQQRVRFSPQARANWMTLSAEFGDGNLKVRVGLAEPMTMKAPVVEMSGTLGLMVDTTSPNREPVRARNLVVEQPNQ